MEPQQDLDDAEDIERARMSADELSWALRSVNRAAAQLDHALADRMSLRPIDYEAMGHIMDREGSRLGPAELGQRLGISTGSATELADRLERAGHIVRSRDPDDRRRVALIPQQETIGRIFGELAPLFDALDALAGDYSDAERAVIERYLRAAAKELRSHARSLDESGPAANFGAAEAAG